MEYPTIVLLLVLIGNQATQQCALSKDYCALCDYHVACEHTVLPSVCGNKKEVKFIVFNETSQELLCNLTHGKRQLVANGQTKFPAAARMASVVWSCELAYLAGENVKQCKMKHEKCRKIDGNPYIGQNIYYKAKTNGHYTYAEAIRLANDAWFNEIANTTQEDMDKLSIANYTHFEEIGHFTQLMQEKIQIVGCGMVQYVSEKNGRDFFYSLVACDYGYGNVLGRPVYTKSEIPASECKTGPHPNFSALCSSAEVYLR